VEQSLLDKPADSLTERDILLRGAAEAFFAQTDKHVAAQIAGCRTDKFVQTTRKSYRDAGFDFTDEDLRMIHECLRELVVRKVLGGNYKALKIE
jgi:hypothetical protein